jgi:rod shape-determining protein MreC
VKSKTVLFVLSAAVALLYFGGVIERVFTLFATTVQSAFLTVRHEAQETLHRHWDQAERISMLEKRCETLERRIIRCESQAQRYRAIATVTPFPSATDLPVRLVRALGYVRLGDFQRLWLEPFDGFDPQSVYGAVRDGYAVGIVLGEKGRPMLSLAGDSDCQFAVYVGRIRAPGIVAGEDPRHMVVRYIPDWMAVRVGDDVYTSGLDRAFPPGIPVGKVLSVTKMQGFKNARIEIYGDTLHPDYIWVVGR